MCMVPCPGCPVARRSGRLRGWPLRPKYVVRYAPTLAVWQVHWRDLPSRVLRIGPAYGRFNSPASALTHLRAFLTSPDAAKARLLDTPA